MELVRNLYERMHRTTRIYRALALLALLAAAALAYRLTTLDSSIAEDRARAADVFYQLKALELEVLRLRADAPEREDAARRRAALQATYDEWAARLTATADEDPQTRAIRAAVARFGEARVLATEHFIGDVRRRIGQWRRTSDFAIALRAARDSAWPSRIRGVLESEHVPTDLLWVAFQESRFDVTAVGPVTRYGVAKGMWQLMPATAREYGLRTGPLVGQPRYDPADERHDFARSTEAAVRYMTDLYALDAQGSGLLVLASYNAGQTRVLRLLRSLPATPRDRNFWRLLERYRSRIPDETYGYVVGVVAASAVAADPATFNLAGVD